MSTDPFSPLPPVFFARPVGEVSADLLGRYFVREVGGDRLVLRVVETEAYLGRGDRASHAYGGRRTRRTETLYLPPGHAYVYLVYGLHHLLNVTSGDPAEGGAVLFRAGEVVAGGDAMLDRRRLGRVPRGGDVAGGPGRFTQALGVDLAFDRLRLDRGSLRLCAGQAVPPSRVAVGTRIGVAYAGPDAALPLRFAIRGHPDVSRPRL